MQSTLPLLRYGQAADAPRCRRAARDGNGGAKLPLSVLCWRFDQHGIFINLRLLPDQLPAR